MEEKIKENAEQKIVLQNRKELSISGTNKVISIKSDLIQLETNYGGIQIVGTNLELVNLDNQSLCAKICGYIQAIKFVQGKSKESFLRKIFKWFFQH